MIISPILYTKPSGVSYDPEVLDWVARVIANGGSVSQTTKNAANVFMLAIKAVSGLRAKILRLNIYAGTGLAACMVPLIKDIGSSPTETSIGAGSDFIESDYSESTGLTGTGRNKYFTTAVVMNTASGTTVDSTHLGVYARTADGSANKYWIGCYDFGSQQDLIGVAGVGTASGAMHDPNQTIGVSSNGIGHYVISRIASNDMKIYKNGSSIVSTTTPGGTRTALSIMVHTFEYQGTGGGRNAVSTGATLAGYHIGAGLTSSDMTSFYSAFQTFQTTLGRQV